MRSSSVSYCVYLFVLLATFLGSVAAGVSKGPGPSHVRPTHSPTPTPTPPLCKKNPVQCCKSTLESNSTAAASLLERLGVHVPKKTVELGINCTSISDEDVRGGFCDEFVLCCRKTFNETKHHDRKNTTIGFDCTDVAV